MQNQQPLRKLELTDEQIQRIKEINPTENTSSSEDTYWRYIAEFGRMYGYEAVVAFLNDDISLDAVNKLVENGRKIDAERNMQMARAMFIAGVSFTPQNKGTNASAVFRNNIRQYEQEMR